MTKEAIQRRKNSGKDILSRSIQELEFASLREDKSKERSDLLHGSDGLVVLVDHGG